MNTKEIQRVLQTICLERERGTHPDAEMISTTLESSGFKEVKPSPGRTTPTFASFTFAQQDQIEGFVEQLINEAHALCMRIQERCPILRADDNGELWDLERVYRAQYHAMVRLRRRCDEGVWIRAHIRKARRWLEEASVETVN